MAEAKPSSYACSSECPGVGPDCYLGSGSHYLAKARYQSALCLTPFEAFPHTDNCARYARFVIPDCEGMAPLEMEARVQRSCQNVESNIAKYRAFTLSAMAQKSKCKSSDEQVKINHALHCVSAFTPVTNKPMDDLRMSIAVISQDARSILRSAKKLARSRREILKLTVERLRRVCAKVSNVNTRKLDGKLYLDDRCCAHNCVSCNYVDNVSLVDTDVHTYVLRSWRLFRGHVHASSCVYCIIKYFSRLVQCIGFFNLDVVRDYPRLVFVIERLEALAFDISVLLETPFDLFSMNNYALHQFMVRVHNRVIETDRFSIEYVTGNTPECFGSAHFGQMRARLSRPLNCADCKPLSELDQFLMHRLWKHVAFTCEVSGDFVKACFLSDRRCYYAGDPESIYKLSRKYFKNTMQRLDILTHIEEDFHRKLDDSRFEDLVFPIDGDFPCNYEPIPFVKNEFRPVRGFHLAGPLLGRDEVDEDEGIEEELENDDEYIQNGQLIRSPSVDSIHTQGSSSIRKEMQQLLQWRGSRDNRQWMVNLLRSSRTTVLHKAKKIASYVQFDLKDSKDVGQLISAELWKLLTQNKGVDEANARRFAVAIWGNMDPVAPQPQERFRTQGCLAKLNPFRKERTPVDKMTDWLDQNFESLGIKKEYISSLNACVWFIYDVITGVNYSVAIMRLLTVGTALTKIIINGARKLYTVLKDCALKLTGNNKRGLFTQGSEKVLDEATNESLVTSMAGLAYSMFSGKEFDNNLNSKYRLNRVVNLSKFMVSIKNIFSFVTSLITKGFNFLVEVLTGTNEAADDIARTMPEITEWMQRFDKIDACHKDDVQGLQAFAVAIRKSTPLAQEVVALKKMSDKWVTRLSAKFTDARHWSFFMNKYTRFMKYYDIAINAVCTQKIRAAPFVVCLTGRPGIGKSNMYKHLLQNMFAIDKMELDLGKDVFTREITCEYWDGYANQPVVYYSDLLQTCDPDVRTLIAGEFIQMAQTTPYPLHMADCSLKSVSFFDSQLVWTDCNQFPNEGDLAKLVRTPAAFTRRFNHIIEVELIGMRNSSGGFDASQATEAFHPEVYRFSEKNQAYDFRDLVVHLYKSWQQHKYKQSQDMKVMPVMFTEEEMEAIRQPSIRTEGVAKRGAQYRKIFNFETGKYEEKEDYVHLYKYEKEATNKYEDASHWILDSDEESDESEGEGIFEQATDLLYTLSNPSSSSISSSSGSWEEQPGSSRDSMVGSFDDLIERHNPYYYYEDRAAPLTPYEKYLMWSENRKADALEFVDRIKRLFCNKSVWGFVTAMFLLPVALSVGWLFPLIDACHSERNQMASHTLKTRIDRALHGAGSIVMKQMVCSWIRQNKVKTALISTFVVLGSVSASVLVYKGVRALFRKRKENLWKSESGETKTQRHDRKIGKLRMQGSNTSPIVVGETDDDQHRHLDANGELVQPGQRKPHWHSCVECKGLYSHVHEVVPYEQSKLSGNVHLCKPCKSKKKVTKVPLEDIYSQASHFGESGENALYKIYSAQFKIKSVKSGCYIMGCWVKPHVMMLPAHFFRNESDAMKDGFFKIFGPNYTLQVHSSDLAIREMSLTRDICLVNIDQRIMPAKPCIYRFLANSYTVLPLDATLLNPKGFNSEKGGWEMMRHCIDDLSMEYGFQWDPKEHQAMTQVQNGMSYTADTKEGDCGSLIVVRDDTGCPKVVGSHMGSSSLSRRGVGTNVDKELVDYLYTKIVGEVTSQGSLCLGPIPEKLGLNVPLCETDDILILGTLPPNLVPNLAKNTKIRGSCLHGLFPVTTAPAMLSLTRGIDPVRNGVKEMCRRNVEMDSNGVADAAVSVGSRLLAMKSPYKAAPRLLTEHETLNGAFLYGTNQPDPYIKKMNMKTSAGWPYSLNNTGGKKNFILGEPGSYVLTEEMRKKVKNLEDSLITHESIPFLFFDCVKDERRPLEKVEAGMSRIFSVGPMDFTFLMRKYTAQFQAHCMRNCVDSGSAVGINPHSPQWCELLRRLTNKGSNFIAGDYKKWDKWVPYELMMAVCEIINRFYDKPPDHADSKIRRALFSGAFGAKRIALSVVYQANGGMPSGTPGTSVFNSLANEILFRYVFEILRQKHCPTLDPGRYHELVAFTAYGDDHILSVSNYLPWFNMVSVAEIYSSMGIGYTNADKTDEILRYVPRESLMYLKRKFGEPIGNFCVAPLDPGVIRESVMWERNGSDTFDISCTIRSAMMEMVHHGVEEYLKFRGILAKDLAAQHRVLPDVSYAYVLNRMRDGTMEPEDFLSWRDPDMAIVEEP